MRTQRPSHTFQTRLILLGGLLAVLIASPPTPAQAQFIPQEELTFLTAEWEGERFDDGRPRVPDEIIERMRNVSIEEAWAVLRNHGYHNQYAGEWEMIHDDVPIVGRALTAQYLPSRPELAERITARGQEQGMVGAMNSWPIDALEQGDVYVADGMGKIADGTLIGDNLGNAIYANSGNGVIFDGSLRDLGGLEQIEGFNAFVRGWHPSYIQGIMLGGLNVPIRIGEALVLPGDVVLARREGVIFIPAQHAAEVVETAEIVMLRDRFGHERLRAGTYTPGQIDTRWSDEIREDFFGWLEANIDSLPVPESRIREILEERTW
jgi:regulator of RNase E activity RraA